MTSVKTPYNKIFQLIEYVMVMSKNRLKIVESSPQNNYYLDYIHENTNELRNALSLFHIS